MSLLRPAPFRCFQNNDGNNKNGYLSYRSDLDGDMNVGGFSRGGGYSNNQGNYNNSGGGFYDLPRL